MTRDKSHTFVVARFQCQNANLLFNTLEQVVTPFFIIIIHFPFEFMKHEYERFSNRGFYPIHKLIQGT